MENIAAKYLRILELYLKLPLDISEHVDCQEVLDYLRFSEESKVWRSEVGISVAKLIQLWFGNRGNLQFRCKQERVSYFSSTFRIIGSVSLPILYWQYLWTLFSYSEIMQRNSSVREKYGNPRNNPWVCFAQYFDRKPRFVNMSLSHQHSPLKPFIFSMSLINKFGL